jgi:3-oxoacyl-[acyl-carrier protein] reductase
MGGKLSVTQREISLEGRVAIVTGAARMRGTGHSIAVALASHGCDVVLNGSGSRPEQWPASEQSMGWRGLESVADEIRSIGRIAVIAVADLRYSDQVDRMISSTVHELGRLDILVNNAAAPRGIDRVNLVELSDDIWQNVLDVKLRGAFHCSRASARVMIAQGNGGRIVNISSSAGKQGAPQMAAYSVANAGLQMLGACLARELGEYGITVNSICVGPVDTSRIDDMGRGEAFDSFITRNVPLNRVGTPEEIAEVVAFLCSDRGSFITAQSINVDGGLVIH